MVPHCQILAAPLILIELDFLEAADTSNYFPLFGNIFPSRPDYPLCAPATPHASSPPRAVMSRGSQDLTVIPTGVPLGGHGGSWPT